MAETRPIAMGVSGIKMGAVGDGIPGTELESLPLPTKASVAFNFSDPKEVKVEIEGTDEPLFSEFVKDTTDYLEFSIPTPSNAVLKKVAGGELDTATDTWKEPTTVPSINQTVEITTMPKQGQQVVYTVVNGKILAKISQAPGKEQAELVMVRVYKQAAITTAGKIGYAFSRQVKAVSEE